MTGDARAAVVLAAGQGTRLRSARPKVLHRAAGRTLLRWALEALRPLDLDRVVVVVGHGAPEVAAEAEAAGVPGLVVVEQAAQRGTGHAVRTAFDAGALDGVGRVLVTYGDAPAVHPATLAALAEAAGSGGHALLTARLPDPTGYGRIVRDDGGGLARIVEHADATPDELAIDEINAGLYAFTAAPLRAALGKVATDNAQGEEYLTDAVGILLDGGGRVTPVLGDVEDALGVNTRAQLATAEAVLRGRLVAALMDGGVTVVDPQHTYVEADVTAEPDATLLPGCPLQGRTHLAAGAVVGPDCRLVDTEVGEGAVVSYTVATQAVIGPRAQVGPFTHLRPGTRLGEGTKAGGFVEMKQAVVGDGSKVPHLSYIGDAEIGTGVNIGAGTITCNYDGYRKHLTRIGDGAFIGSNASLVAPVEIGPGAYTAAGSTITSDVPADALGVGRARQTDVAGWAVRWRRRHEDHEGEGT